ncbi:MAG: hypothetical protein SangKO_029300 [Sandaracinaceae bacterium]
MKTQVTRLVVRGPEAWTSDRAERLLLSALERAQHHQGLSILQTPGGFLRAPWPAGWAGRTGWKSRPKDVQPLIDSAAATVQNTVTRQVLAAARRQGVDFITLGVDLFPHSHSGSRVHGELVAVLNASDGRVVGWTGKSYPTAYQERHLVQVEDLSTHLMNLGGVQTLVLGCHDLNMFSARGRATQREGGHRHRRSTAMRELVRESPPQMVLHHPHTVDTPRIWSTAWSGLRKAIPTADVWASGVWFHDWRDGPRGTLDTALSGTASDGVADVVLHLPLDPGCPVMVLVHGQWEWGQVVDGATASPVDADDSALEATTTVRLDFDGQKVDVPAEFLLWHDVDLPVDEERRDARDVAPLTGQGPARDPHDDVEKTDEDAEMADDEKAEIWRRVRALAQKHLSSGEPIHTLKRRVPNIITSVDDESIARRSEEGKTNSTRVTRQMVFDAWDTLRTNTPHGDPLVFTYALLLAALPDRVVMRDGGLALRERP